MTNEQLIAELQNQDPNANARIKILPHYLSLPEECAWTDDISIVNGAIVGVVSEDNDNSHFPEEDETR